MIKQNLLDRYFSFGTFMHRTRTKTSFRYANENDREKRERRREREKERYKERYREEGRYKRERERESERDVKGAQSKPNPSRNAFPKLWDARIERKILGNYE